MSNFRIKKVNNREENIKGSNTLEKKHMDNVKKINENRDNLDNTIDLLNNLNLELNILDEKRENNEIVNLEYRASLLNKKDKYENEIENIKKNNKEINYYDLTGDLLNKYYNLREEDSTGKSSINIMNILNSKNKKEKVNEIDTKSRLFENYCQRVDGIRVNKDDGSDRIKYCEYCFIEKTLEPESSSYVCTSCGLMEYVLLDEDRMIKEYSPYERKNHFKDWLKQIQAKESVEISEEIFNKIVLELRKNKYYSNKKNVNRSVIQKILKKLGHSKLYKHTPFIINKITGNPAPTISREIEDKFIKMFEMIQEPWEMFKPKGRKNFISYPYILYKFCELLELEYLLDYFPMLDFPNLAIPDKVWKQICGHLKWEFYPTE
jgi:hypothetical protein